MKKPMPIISFRIPLTVVKELRKISKREGIPLGQLMRTVIKRFLEAKGGAD